MMASRSARPRIEQHLAAILVNASDELRVRRLGLLQDLGLRTPQQTKDVDAAVCRPAQHLADLRTRTAQTLPKVAPKVQEIHLVPADGRFQLDAEPSEICPPVDQRDDQVAGRESAQISPRVSPVALSKKPRRDRGSSQDFRSVLLQRVPVDASGVGKHPRIVHPVGRDRCSQSIDVFDGRSEGQSTHGGTRLGP